MPSVNGPDTGSPAPSPQAGGRERPAPRVRDDAARRAGTPGPPGRSWWQSLEERADDPSFREALEREFPSLASEINNPVTRRGFLQFMGASLALAGAAGCRWPAREAVPFARRPRGMTPGMTASYATAIEWGGVARGLLVTSYDGRPIKVEGNPLHPGSRGATDAIAQAAVLGLYDPDRSAQIIRRDRDGEKILRWAEFDEFAAARAADREGAPAVLAPAMSSPTVERLRARLGERFPRLRWVEYEPVSRDSEREGTRIAFARPMRVRARFDRASRIVALDADPLYGHPDALAIARRFAEARDPGRAGGMNRLYSFEPTYTVTGAMADHRYPVRRGAIAGVVAALATALSDRHSVDVPASVIAAARGEPAIDADLAQVVEVVASDLAGRQGESIVVVGPGQPPEVHALAAVINHALGAVGTTLDYTAAPDPDRPSHGDAIAGLTDAMRGGEIDTLLILGGNPVFDAPRDLGFADALGTVPVSIHLGLYRDETAVECTWHLPMAHDLESWGDARGWDGAVSTQQPLIAPLHGGRTAAEILAAFAGEAAPSGYELCRATFAGDGPIDEDAWRRAIHDGVVTGSAWPAERPAPGAARVASAWRDRSPGPDGTELVFVADRKVYDGRFANNGWLQELPDPVTRLTWENPALVGPADARDFGVSTGDRLSVGVDAAAVELTVFVMPGQARGSIAAAIGYGRQRAGRVGNGAGVDLYALRPSPAVGAIAARIEPVAGRRPVSTVQDHSPIDAVGRAGARDRVPALILQGTAEEHAADPTLRAHRHHQPPPAPLWKEHDYPGNRWASAIDLNRCIGCGACVTACQAENNVPVVGRDGILRGREMHWLRVDRYFGGSPDAPSAAHQPVACVHCENAPCEQVCPVAATLHDSEGLNVMVYNRCVGTRYCANNCPYKVRRFNFFNYHRGRAEVEKLLFNPEVTVRSRGVMEKCTYCIQRIHAVKIDAANDGHQIDDGEITPACAQACPTDAIVFGDLNDPDSRVRAAHDDARSYSLLGELNVKPRTAYLARLRNPNPALETRSDEHAGGH